MTDYSPNLDIALLDENMMEPQDVVNAAIDALDAKITGTVDVVIGHTNAAELTQDEQAGGSIFELNPGGSPGPTGDSTVTFAPFGMGVFAVVNNTAFPVTLEYSGQALAAPVLDANAVGLFSGDGANIRVYAGGSAGAGGIVIAMEASEDMAAGAMANLWDSGGARMRNANATDGTKPAHGFSMTAVSSGDTGIFYGPGQINNRLTGLTPGSYYWLDVNNGDIVDAAPSGTGNLVLLVGFALSATQLAFAPALPGVLLP